MTQRTMLANQIGNRICIEYFYPVPVGVCDESEPLHAAIIGLFHEVKAELLEPDTRC